jgi:mannosyltransferase
MTPSESLSNRDRYALILLVVAAAILRIVGLNQQFWLDEIGIIQSSIRRSPLVIMTKWPGAASHILFELLASQSARLFGETPVALRLPAVLFGIAGVWAFARLALRLLPRSTAWVASVLFTLSYHHVFFSQDARGYTTLIFFFLLATERLLALLEKPHSIGIGLTYAVTGSLAAYAQLFGAVIVPGQFLALCAVAWYDRRRSGSRYIPLKRVAVWGAVSMAVTLALYAPFLSSILSMAQTSRAIPAEGPHIGFGLLFEVIQSFHDALLGSAGLLVGLVIGAIGGYVCLRSRPVAVLAMLTPLLLQLLVFGAMGMPVHPRYFAIALPLVYLFASVGLVTAVRTVFRSRAQPAGTVVLTGLMLVSAVPLVRYYKTPKQDFLGAMRFVDSASAPGDRKAGVDLAGRVITGFYRRADYDFVWTLQDLVNLEQSGKGVWAITTLDRILWVRDSALASHLRTNYTRVAVLPGTLGDGAMRIYRFNRAP